MIRHDSRTATVVLWEIAGKKVLTAKSSSSSRAQASLDLAWPWKPCIVHNHSFAATAPKRLDLKTPQSDVCAWFGKSPMDANTAHCASLIKINETTNYYSVIFSHYLETKHSSLWNRPIMCLLNKLWHRPNETCWMWSFLECKPGSLANIHLERGTAQETNRSHLAERKSS